MAKNITGLCIYIYQIMFVCQYKSTEIIKKKTDKFALLALKPRTNILNDNFKTQCYHSYISKLKQFKLFLTILVWG
jgi:hypothetical protein